MRTALLVGAGFLAAVITSVFLMPRGHAQIVTGYGSGANTTLSNLGTTAINTNLLFSPDNTFNIGANGASRPGSIFAAGTLNAANLTLSANVLSSLLFSPDATLNIGAAGATRPLNIFVSSGVTAGGTVSGATYSTATTCTSSSGTCGSAAAGQVTIAAAATTVTVATTAVHTGSQIFLGANTTLGGALGVTCNTTAAFGQLEVTTVTNNTSFVITISAAPTTNPECIQYWIVN